MNNARTPRAAAAVLTGACLLAAASVIGGCSKKLSTVDPGYTEVEGVTDPSSRLLVYPDLPVTVQVWKDNVEQLPTDPPTEILGTWNPAPQFAGGDVLLSERIYYPSGAGSIHGLILDGSQANAFQMLRRESGGGLRIFQDFELSPARRWLDTATEMYAFTDPAPTTFSPPSYVGRGLVQGAVRQNSPVTNEAQLTGLDVADITVTSVRISSDSLFTLQWNPVPGAAGYWIHVFDYQPSVSDLGRRVAAAPSPLVTAPTHDYLVAFAGPSATSYRMGSSSAQILTFRPSAFRFGQVYNARIAAVDSDSRLIAMTFGRSRDFAVVQPTPGEAGHLTVSPRGAVTVTVSH